MRDHHGRERTIISKRGFTVQRFPEPQAVKNDPGQLRPVLYAFMIEGLLAFGTEREIMGPVLRDAVFGSTVEAQHYEFVQRGVAPSANRPVL